jgi:hypothetical protein
MAATVWTASSVRQLRVAPARLAAATAAVDRIAVPGRGRNATAHPEIRRLCAVLLYTCDGHCGIGHPDVTVVNCQIAPGVPLNACDRVLLAATIRANTVVEGYQFHHMNLCAADLNALANALVTTGRVSQLNFGEFTMQPQSEAESESVLASFARIVAEMKSLQQMYIDQHMSRALRQQGINIGAELEAKKLDGGPTQMLMSHSGRGRRR